MDRHRVAPAKVNLYLHVGAVAPDGYHPISSLMTFATVGDVVALEPAVGPSFAVTGPFAGALAEEDAGANLVERAHHLLAVAFPGRVPPLKLMLDKRLPIAAGLGGGSSDAAATLTLLAEAFELDDRAALAAIARELGADVTACMAARPVIARGRGDEVSDPPPFPETDAVLVNPLVPSATGPVYRAFDAAPHNPAADDAAWPPSISDAGALAVFLARCRNDLEAPAISLQPAIGVVLDDLKHRPQTLIARMSGSGATCFALCADAGRAAVLAAEVGADHPGWWVRACRFAGVRP
ncbi:MAG TPA: 4-(cytidine 5'-diphospho)-2-C-methyl-D-erythritol kinase [Caulobacteraceae bacterium]|jgi:4-diphosphocytidyl-2-C-methyl-D-erythritol kinase